MFNKLIVSKGIRTLHWILIYSVYAIGPIYTDFEFIYSIFNNYLIINNLFNVL